MKDTQSPPSAENIGANTSESGEKKKIATAQGHSHTQGEQRSEQGGADLARKATEKSMSSKHRESKASVGSDGTKRLRVHHTFAAPMLCAAVFLLLLLSKTVNLVGIASNTTEAYLSLTAVQLFVFLLPCVLYIRYRSLDMRTQLRVRMFSPDKIMFTILCALLLILSSMLISTLDTSIGNSVYSWGYLLGEDSIDQSGINVLYYAICFALLPALCEEILFRGVIMSEYQHSSIAAAVFINSLFFAMLHFEIEKLPFYFFAGLVLTMCAYAANSIVASMISHLLYNLFAIFGGKVVSTTASALGDVTLIRIVLTVLFLLMLMLCFGECQRIYASYARKNKPSDYLPQAKSRDGAVRFFSALLSPMALICIVIYIVSVFLLK